MRRRLFNIIAMISALLFGVVVLFWVRSYTSRDILNWCGNPNLLAVCTRDGLIGIVWSKRDLDLPQEWRGITWNTERDMPVLGYRAPDLGPGTTFGFRFESWQPSRSELAYNGWSITAPFWSLAILSAILPLIVIHRKIRTRHRDPFACLTCGYDLRATPDRCPECGTTTANGG